MWNQKRFYNSKIKQVGIRISPLAEIPPFQRLAEIIELRKVLII